MVHSCIAILKCLRYDSPGDIYTLCNIWLIFYRFLDKVLYTQTEIVQ